jgi:seryl-tRNA synthetase
MTMKMNLRNPKLISALWKSLAGIHWLTLCILVFKVSAYFAGLHANRIESLLPPFLKNETESGEMEPASLEEPGLKRDADVDDLLVELRNKIRKIHQYTAALKRELREKKINLQLLRAEGFSDGSDAVRELISRVDHLEEKIQAGEHEAAEAANLREKLVAALSAAMDENRTVGVEQQLRKEVLKVVNRMAPSEERGFLIPVSAWKDTASGEE